MNISAWVLIAVLFELTARACIWDSDTLSDEQHKSADMAKVILASTNQPIVPVPLRNRIIKLMVDPHENDPAWWNELAGAHLRLGEAREAAEILKPLIIRFPADYGIHANLGTAYHLLGRYKEAEKEIARDLEINPDAHFGLEKYHLALLQYLIRDPEYQMRHVYVDEFTYEFLNQGESLYVREGGAVTNVEPVSTNQAEMDMDSKEFNQLIKGRPRAENESLVEDRLATLLSEMAGHDRVPDYRVKWNLGQDPKLNEGVLYMATLNPNEPACFVMLGAVCLKNGDKNLAAAALEKAVALGSPQAGWLQYKIIRIQNHIHTAQGQKTRMRFVIFLGALVLVLVVIALFWLLKKLSRS